MKIVVTGTRGFPGVQGGVETHCEHLYPFMIEKNCDIIVFSRESYVNRDNKTFKGIKLVPLSCPGNKFLEAIVHTVKSVFRARRFHPDVLHIHAIGPSLFVPLARLLGMKVVVTNHGPDYQREKWTLPAKIFLKFCESMGMLFANEIISIATNIADDVKKKYGRESTVIPNGVVIPYSVHTDEYINKFGLKDQKYILAVGRLVPEKGFDDLMAAFTEGSLSNMKLVIVGDADHENKYSRSLKEKAQKNKNIILTGFVKGQPLEELYSNANLFVLPSHHEGLPIVLLEAMSYGLSCIASDIPANRNVKLSDDRYFAAGDIHEISRKIQEFINRPWNSEQRKMQIDMINNEFNWGKIADMTLQVYENVISKHS